MTPRAVTLALALLAVVGCRETDAAHGDARAADSARSTVDRGVQVPAPPQAADTFRVHIPAARRLVGMYAYMADAGTFTPCGSDEHLSVSAEGDNASLERAYLAARHDPGAPVLVTLEGRVESRPPMEGGGMHPTLIVYRFGHVWPGETCAKAHVRTPLVNTYWQLVELGGKPVEPVPGQVHEAHLMLRKGEPSARGFGGCTDFSAAYTLRGQSLAFSRIAATPPTCPAADGEQALLNVLGRVTRYEIEGESLLLMDADGSLARFRAVYFH